MTPSDFVRLLLDPIRLAVAGDAVTGSNDVDALATRLGIDAREVAEARGKLMAAGLLDGDGINRDALRAIARALPQDPPPS
ncbi:MAG: hypothetical protein HKN91_13265, partial [Acidimicrobiia bacterium]|nr:hypothetical protein [Acidimicrobiia bacterium]